MTTSLSDERAGAAYELLLGRGDGAGLPRHRGRADLRGLHASVDMAALSAGEPAGLLGPDPRVQGVTWRGLDLTGARLDGIRFRDCVIEDCVFDKASCEDWRMWGSVVRSCSFEGATLNGALGTHHEGVPMQWERVSFDRCDLRGRQWYGSVMRECTFRSAKLKSLEFNQMTLSDLVFEGKLSDVIFDNRELEGRVTAGPLTRVDFRNAVFDYTGFRGCTFVECTMPDDPDVHLLKGFGERGREAVTALRRMGTKEAEAAAGILEGQLELAGPDFVYVARDFVVGRMDLRGPVESVLFGERTGSG